MKELNLYEIKEMAVKSKRTVFTTAELANMIGKSKEVANVYIDRMIKKGLATKLLAGKISFTDDEYVIATQLIEPSYISLNSALHFYGHLQQVPKFIECITAKASRKYDFLGIRYHKIHPSLFFGFKRVEKGLSYIFIAEPEKALLDSIYLSSISKDQAMEIREKLNEERIREYIKIWNQRLSKKIREWLL
ncbi:MAG: hypothetical protein N2312_01725 [Dictyoglomaceae bacterium]|nr:hypothetical protein [Dictyoglomaceae bacterium]